MTFLRVKDGIVNLASIQYIRRTQSTITLYLERDIIKFDFNTEDEAIDYICGLSSILYAKEPEVSK